jgi:hypothetical protein
MGNFREGTQDEIRSQQPPFVPDQIGRDPTKKEKNFHSICDLHLLNHPFHHAFHLYTGEEHSDP